MVCNSIRRSDLALTAIRRFIPLPIMPSAAKSVRFINNYDASFPTITAIFMATQSIKEVI